LTAAFLVEDLPSRSLP